MKRQQMLKNRGYPVLSGVGRVLLVLMVFMVSTGLVFAQKTVTGTVTGTNNTLLPGVTIVVKGTTLGTLTDASGKYSLTNIPENATLVFSFIGMTTQEIPTTGKIQIDVVLKEEVVGLEEVVIVGYGVQKKESVVSAVSQTTGTNIRQRAQGGDLANAFAGTMPGLQVLKSTGLAGGITAGFSEYSQLLIRGVKTWNTSSPLVLVDGVERSLNELNQYDIENVSILKDASATAVYGVRGANGVILVTTNRGMKGKPQLSVNTITTIKTAVHIPTRPDSYTTNFIKDYAILNEVPYDESAWKSIVPGKYLEYYKNQKYPYYFPDVDWVKAMLKDYAVDNSFNLNLSGGTDFVRYFSSLGYFLETDILNIKKYAKEANKGYDPSYRFQRINFRTNLDFNLTKTTVFSVNLSGYHRITNGPGASYSAPGTADVNRNAWGSFYVLAPDMFPIRYDDGVMGERSIKATPLMNPVMAFLTGSFAVKHTTVNTDFNLKQKLDFITEGLSANAKIAYDNDDYSSGPTISGFNEVNKFIYPNIIDAIKPGMTEAEIKKLEPSYTYWTFPFTGTVYDYNTYINSYASETVNSYDLAREAYSLYYELSMNYARDFGKHAVSGLGLMSRRQRTTGSVFPNYREDWVGRVTYAYDRRYFLEANGSYNGSEKFSSKHRFGFFPSLAVGWSVSNEAFFKSLKSVVSNLKFRYSDGKVGSDEGMPRWEYTSGWNNATYRATFGTLAANSPYVISTEGTVPNSNLEWETVRKKDLGIETGFFNDQLRIVLDFYNEDRKNIYRAGSGRFLESYMGMVPSGANVGEIKSHGFEFDSRFIRTTSRGLTFWLSYSWCFHKDMVIKTDAGPLVPYWQKLDGYELNISRGYITQGKYACFQNWNAIYNTAVSLTPSKLLPGDQKIIDYNADGYIDSNDIAPVGYGTWPNYTYAPAFGISFKNFSAQFNLSGVYNVEGANTFAGYRTFYANYDDVQPQDVKWCWMPERNITETARDAALRWVGYNTGRTQGYNPWTRAYLKLENAEIAYTLNTPRFKKMGVTDIKFSLRGENLHTWSHMFDEFEVVGYDVTRYPLMRKLNFGLSLNFQ